MISPTRTISRRTLAVGAAWSAPLVVAAAPPAFAGTSLCQVQGSVQVGPNTSGTMRAVCVSQSQQASPPSIYDNYGTVNLPAYLEICNCQQEGAYYRWQEQDDLSNFQIEVDGVHDDQYGPNQGSRPPFYLAPFGGVGGCEQYSLTYRTSAPRPTTDTSVSITFKLQTRPGTSGPWTDLQTLTVSGTIRRTTSAYVNFNDCSPQGGAARSGNTTSKSAATPAPSGQASPEGKEAAPAERPARTGD